MEFSCLTEDLIHGITTVERAVETKEVTSIQTGIYLEAKQGQLRLVASDLELSIECFIPAQTVIEGSAVIDGKFISQLVRKLDGPEVNYKHVPGESMTTIHSGKASFNIHILNSKDYPLIPQIHEIKTWTMNQSVLRRMIRQTVFAAANDDSRPFLNGVFLEIDEEELRLVATDSSRLAFRRAKLTKSAGSIHAIVPTRTLGEMQRLLASEGSQIVEFAIVDQQIVFHMDQTRVISRLIEGQFPNYQQVFPTDQPVRALVDKQQLQGAIERAALLAKKGPPVIRLAVQNQVLAITAREAEAGQVYEELEITHEGIDGETAYQARFLLDMLRAIDTEKVRLELADGLRQGSLRPVGDEDYLYVVMPVRVG